MMHSRPLKREGKERNGIKTDELKKAFLQRSCFCLYATLPKG